MEMIKAAKAQVLFLSVFKIKITNKILGFFKRTTPISKQKIVTMYKNAKMSTIKTY